MRCHSTSSHYTRQPCRTIISVCQSSGCYVIPAGWTFREGPRSEQWSWCFQTEQGRRPCHGLKGVQPALGAFVSHFPRHWSHSGNERLTATYKTPESPLIECLAGFRWTRAFCRLVLLICQFFFRCDVLNEWPSSFFSFCCLIGVWIFLVCNLARLEISTLSYRSLWDLNVESAGLHQPITLRPFEHHATNMLSFHWLTGFHFFYLVRTRTTCQVTFLGWIQTLHFRPFRYVAWTTELRSKARARNSGSRDRRRRRSRDRGRDDSRGRDANPPFSIFPQAETNESSSSLRLTPNTQSQSRGHDQDLTTWRHIVDVEPPPIARRYPPAPVLHHWPWPFILIEAFNMTWTVHHPGRNRISSTNWFNQFTIQNNNIKQLHLHSTFNFALNQDNFIHHPTAAPYQNPEISAPWLRFRHPEDVKIIAPPIFPLQNFFDLVKVEFQKVAQKPNDPIDQMTESQLALDLLGPTMLINNKMDIAKSRPQVWTWIPNQFNYTCHCQQTTSKMVSLWIQDPYCWLHCDQLVDACQGPGHIKDFWFKLWHALDKWKTEAVGLIAFLLHMNFLFLELLSCKWTTTYRSISSRRSRASPAEKTFDHGKLRSTPFPWCLHNGQIGTTVPLTSSLHTISPTSKKRTNTSWFATTNGLTILSLLLRKDTSSQVGVTLGTCHWYGISIEDCIDRRNQTSGNHWRGQRTIPLAPKLLLPNRRKPNTWSCQQGHVHPTEHCDNHPHPQTFAVGTQAFHLSRHSQEPSTTTLSFDARWSRSGVHSLPLFRHHSRTREEVDGQKSPCYYDGFLSLDGRLHDKTLTPRFRLKSPLNSWG